jgi:hypothetical protein
VDKTPFDWIAYSLLALLGMVAVLFLTMEAWARWQERRAAQSAPTEPEPVRRSRQEPAIPEPTGVVQAPRPRASVSHLRGQLQALLNRGVALEQGATSPLLAMSILTPQTRTQDVEAWEAEVEAALRERPRDLALFLYEQPRSPLDAIGVTLMTENPLKRRLHQRNKQLETIIKRLP